MKKTFREFHLLKILNSFDFKSFPLDIHIGQYFRQHRSLGSKDRKMIGNRVYELIRWYGLIDFFCQKPIDWEERNQTLYQLNFREILNDSSIPPHIRCSFPEHFFSVLANQYGKKEALNICFTSNTFAPITIRTNVLKTTRLSLLNKWKGKYSCTPTKHSIWGIHFTERKNFQEFQEFKQGFFEVQDEASQLIANLVDPKPGDLVLDYCAGAGGKTLAFAHKLQGRGQIFLHDIRAHALTQAKKRLKRAGIQNGQIILSTTAHLNHLKNEMDWVLVDVPCSGSGTLRRNPDLKLKFSLSSLKELVQKQREIFENALAFLAPHGKIVYSTCSILAQENQEQIEYFQKTYHLDIISKPFQSLPIENGMDGFFGAVLQKLS